MLRVVVIYFPPLCHNDIGILNGGMRDDIGVDRAFIVKPYGEKLLVES